MIKRIVEDFHACPREGYYLNIYIQCLLNSSLTSCVYDEIKCLLIVLCCISLDTVV